MLTHHIWREGDPYESPSFLTEKLDCLAAGFSVGTLFSECLYGDGNEDISDFKFERIVFHSGYSFLFLSVYIIAYFSGFVKPLFVNNL
jgi:hypothetical protein